MWSQNEIVEISKYPHIDLYVIEQVYNTYGDLEFLKDVPVEHKVYYSEKTLKERVLELIPYQHPIVLENVENCRDIVLNWSENDPKFMWIDTFHAEKTIEYKFIMYNLSLYNHKELCDKDFLNLFSHASSCVYEKKDHTEFLKKWKKK